MNDGTDKEDLQKALEVLKKGGVIVYPTETVWGIGCDATNPEAVKKIFAIKRRSDAKALISLVSDQGMLARWVDDIPDAAYALMDVADRPLTIIYDRPRGLAPELLADDGSAALRVTSDPYASALCRALRRPLVSTSANFSGDKAPEKFDDIPVEILDSADYVCSLRHGEEALQRPSSVIKVSEGNVIKIIRP